MYLSFAKSVFGSQMTRTENHADVRLQAQMFVAIGWREEEGGLSHTRARFTNGALQRGITGNPQYEATDIIYQFLA